MKLNNFFKLVITIVVSQLAGVIGSVFMVSTSSPQAWYAGLVKPALNPPGWIFGPVWTTLYALMGVAAWLVWKQWSQGSPSTRLRVKTALAVFGLQLFLNAVWSIIFFGLQNPGAAFIEIIFLWLAIVATIIVFSKISRRAAWLLVPYILWVSFAGYLNYSIWQLQNSETRTVKLHYYNQELDKDKTGNILCSRQGLAPVEREIPITQTPIQDTIKLLLSSGLADLEGVTLRSASLKEGLLTLEFNDPNNKTVGGACRVGILWFQIEATAKQFPEVQRVRFLPEEIFQP